MSTTLHRMHRIKTNNPNLPCSQVRYTRKSLPTTLSVSSLNGECQRGGANRKAPARSFAHSFKPTSGVERPSLQLFLAAAAPPPAMSESAVQRPSALLSQLMQGERPLSLLHTDPSFPSRIHSGRKVPSSSCSCSSSQLMSERKLALNI